jgi:hypothetical protein
MFWLTLVALVLLPKIGSSTAPSIVTPLIAGPAGPAFGSYLAIWGLFTAVLFIGTLRLNRALQVVFGTLTILFFMLALGKFTDMGEGFEHITGYEGIVCGLSAMYAGLAQVLNEVYGQTVLPLGPVAK